MTRLAWFQCSSGIAGDMALGALLDAGADLAEVRALLGRLPVSGWALEVEATQRAGVGATRAVVTAPEHDQPARFLREIEALIAAAAYPARLTGRALASFRRLATAEGAVHRIDPGEVHFHEVGALDAIVDVVGTCAALEVLAVDDVRASPVALGVGTITAAHGALPNPPPAVVELLRGAPTFGVDTPLELTTPTGAALLAALVTAWGPSPPMTLRAVGYGAGGRDLPNRANVTQVVIGDAPTVAPSSSGQPVLLFEVNVDDATGEVLAHAISTLLRAGAYDAWVTPIVMKKGRPAHTVHALCDPALADAIASTLVAESGSLGVRAQRLERWPQARAESIVNVSGEPIRVKVAAGRAKAEHDDAALAATRLGIPLREVLRLAEAAASPDLDANPGEP